MNADVGLLRGGRDAADITTTVVRLIGEQTGRGPTKARTYLADDMIVVVLEETLTHGERALVDSGRGELALATRQAHLDAIETQLIDAVESLSSREVRACVAASKVDPDILVKTFLLGPA